MKNPPSQSLGETIIASEQAWRAADHVLKVTFPVVQDPKLLLRALEHLDSAARKTISAILKHEYIYRQIPLKRSGAENLEQFFNQCTQQYNLSIADSARLRSLLKLGKRHRASSMEFSQKGKMMVLDDEQGSIAITSPQLLELSEAVRTLQLQLQKELKTTAQQKAEEHQSSRNI